jgi:hypothetical protein
MTQTFNQDNVAIFAYGSLLSEPGAKLAPHIVAEIAWPSPWPVEYARRAPLRGDGPTLVIHKAGGIVHGKLLILDISSSVIGEVEEWLWEREGKPPREGIKRMEWGGFRQVLYCDLESTLGEGELSAEALARFAIASVGKKPERNAIRYLAQNIEQGVITPLTYAYREAILRATGGRDLEQAEQIILRTFR